MAGTGAVSVRLLCLQALQSGSRQLCDGDGGVQGGIAAQPAQAAGCGMCGRDVEGEALRVDGRTPAGGRLQ